MSSSFLKLTARASRLLSTTRFKPALKPVRSQSLIHPNKTPKQTINHFYSVSKPYKPVWRHFATWTEPIVNQAPVQLVDHFPQVETADLINLVSRNYSNKSTLSPNEMKDLEQYISSLNRRAENGDVEAQLHLAISNSELSSLSSDSKPEDSDYVSESVSWLEMAASKGNDRAQYYLGLYLLTNSISNITSHQIGVPKPEPPYYIDIDNLDSFLGIDKGINQIVEDPNEAFDFKKWLRKERRKLLQQRKQSKIVSSSNDKNDHQSVAQADTATAEANTQSCSSKKAAKRSRGLQLLSDSDQQGNLDATISLAIIYLDTEADYFNESLGIELLNKASKSNSEHHKALAELKLGEYSLYRLKSGIPAQDPLSFVHHFETSAELGNDEAQYFLATLYFDGFAHPNDENLILVQQDESKAMYWLQSSASKGHKHALYYLATLYRLESEHEPNQELDRQVIALLTRATTGSEPHELALLSLGEIYFNGLCGQSINYPLALKYFKASSKLGNCDALVNVGVMYYSGLGTTVDFEKAFYSYQNAAILHSPQAMRNLADMYERGIGVPESQTHAKYYRALADETEFGKPAGAPAILEDLLSSAASPAANSNPESL